MKKLLSLMLVAVMLLATLSLTSCDLSAIFGGSSTTTTPPEAEIRTTVTELEWRKVYASKNFTVTVKQGGEEMTYIFSDEAIKMNLMGIIDIIVDRETGAIIFVSESGYTGGTFGDDLVPVDKFDEMTLGNSDLLPAIDYKDLVYSEETKTYSFSHENYVCEFTFENGILVKGELLSKNTEYGMSIIVANVGTTVFEVPEYTNITDGIIEPSKAGKDVVTTITSADFEALLNMNNFTITGDILFYHLSMKQTATESVTVVEMPSMGIKEETYTAIIDGYIYDIESQYSGYVATSTGEAAESMPGFLDVFPGSLTLSDLKYNEEGRYYEIESDEMKLCLFFENGKLVKLIVVGDVMDMSASIEIELNVSDIGTTKVDLPEYTVYVDHGQVTEEQWNEIFACTNFTANVEVVNYGYTEENGYITQNETYTVALSENGYAMHNLDSGEEILMAFENGVAYSLYYDEGIGGYVGFPQNGFDPSICRLGTLIEFDFNYSEFSYFSYLSEYIYQIVDEDGYSIDVNVKFNDGEIVSIQYSKYSYEYSYDLAYIITFSNVGTTVVELPEYTVAE